ncbi:MAG: hypothetical protein ACI33K_03345 [Clostridiaceae bacterium]
MKINVKNLLLLILIIISIGTTISLINITEKYKSKNQLIFDTVKSQLLFIGDGVNNVESDRDLRQLASTSGGILYTSTYSDKFKYEDHELFLIIQAFFLSVEIKELNEIDVELSDLIKKVALHLEDKASRDKLITIMNEYIK